MRKLIAVLMALMMVFGAVCSFAEEDGATETGEEVQEITGSPEDDADVPEEEPEDEGEEEEDEDLPEDEAADEDETADEDGDEDADETEEDEDLPEDETEEEDEEASEDEPADEEDAGESGQNGRGTGSKVKAPSLWKAAADPTVTEELQALFDKGLERLLGVDYVPLVFLGTWGEDEAGYAFLCQATVVVPDAEPEWSIVFLYEDEDGRVMLWDISDLDLDMYCDFSADA